jgi:RHS repeat-associated protein
MENDYTGTRVKKNAPAGISLYPFQGYEIDPNGVITKLIRVGGEPIASKRGTSKYFYHNDHLGSVNVVTDIAGTRVQLNEYDPWGAVSRASGTIDPDTRFTGQKLDPETGLYYYGGRYYDAEIGRFVSADPFVQTPSRKHEPSLKRSDLSTRPRAESDAGAIKGGIGLATLPGAVRFRFSRKPPRIAMKGEG